MHHGLANGIMIDHALAFNTDAVPGRFQIMAQTVGLKDATPTAFLRWLSELKEKTGIAKSVAAAGVSKDKLDELVKVAFEDSCHGNNPKPVKADDFRKIFTAAFA
jgi:alcohol dehydrogenase class IV